MGILTVALALVASACGSDDSVSDKVTLQLNWYHEAEFVGYYVADAKGFYRDADLDVAITQGGPGIPARDYVVDGRADFAVSSFGEQQDLLAAGKPTVAVFSVFQIPPLVMFSLDGSGIREPKDMVGKRIGMKNDYWKNIAHQTLTNAGVDLGSVIEVPVKADEQALLYEGKVDVWMGYAHDEPIEAQVSGHPVSTVFPADYGVGGYEGLLLTAQATIARDPSLVERFVKATRRGWEYAVEHPDEAAAVMTEWQPKDDLDFQKLAVKALVPLVDVPQAAIGSIDAKRWEKLMGGAFDAARPGYDMSFLSTEQ